NMTAVAPDVGSVKRVRSIAEALDIPMAIIDKRRPEPNQTEVMNIIGESKITGSNVILFDDIIDTGGTITQAANVLKENGAAHVYACATHGLFSGPAVKRINESAIKELVVTNSIPQDKNRDKIEGLKVISLASLLGEAIDRIFKDLSVSVLF
ncbi:MAG: ribose-phosphate diphosphokinase, partial [Halanaerobiales bacterium]